jgi:GNAT superfamily N-acetyltransferase/predicted CoA-binding protein
MRAVSPPLPAADDTVSRAVLRDGSVVQLRMAAPSDHQALTRFFHELSPESRRLRFFAITEPSDDLLTRFCDSTDLSRNATLLALRLDGGDLRPIAVGSYFSTGDATAEVAFAVDDRFHGKGLGTMLLERLATIAGAHGFKRFEATTLTENAAMLEVFHESGFEIRSKSDRGCVNVLLSIDPTGASVNAARAARCAVRPPRRSGRCSSRTQWPWSARPRTTGSIGRRVLRALVAGGFTGPVYPINPNADELDGVRCYPSLSAAPLGIDLAVVAVPRPAVLGVVDECAAAGVKSLVVITAGFAETGADGRSLQQALLDKVRGHGLRMVGPNCMGLLNANPRFPAERVVLADRATERRRRAVLAERCPRHGDSGARERARRRPVHVRQRRQQGRCLGQRPAAVLGSRSDDERHPAVPRVVRQHAAVCAAGAAHQQKEADCRPEGRPDPGRLTRRGQPYRSARRQRHGSGRVVSAVGRHPRRYDRRDVRHRRLPRLAAAACRTSRGDRHQRGRTRDPGGGCL